MIRPHSARYPLKALAWLALLAPTLVGEARAQAPPPSGTGQFFTIRQPITSEGVQQVQAAALSVIESSPKPGPGPVLVFELRPGTSDFGSVYELAKFLSTRLTGAKQTVAYVPEPLSGYGVLAALACDEIVMGPEATIGPITPPDQPVNHDVRDFLVRLAGNKGRTDTDLLIGMLDPSLDLRKVQLAEGTRYVLAENLPKLNAQQPVLDNQPAWEGGQRGILTAERARSEGLAKQLPTDRGEVAAAYNLPSTSDNLTLGQASSTVWIKVEGPLDDTQEHYIRQRIALARDQKKNLIFFKFDSPGGLAVPADKAADLIAEIKDMKTVAYIDDAAVGVSALPALACDEIVFHRGSRIGNISQAEGAQDPLKESDRIGLADRAEDLARKKGHPAAVARAMVDPEVVVVEARDNRTGVVGLFLDSRVKADPARFVAQGTKKEAGSVLEVNADQAAAFRLTHRKVVEDEEEFKSLFGLRNQKIDEFGKTWVDSLVATLNTSWMSGLLLFVGLFMLILELKMPGIGLPGITAALAFLLFFWSHYLSGTADQLEIILFLVGLICLALELFVFPGFGVFGMSGILLILVSVVMASHTFVWPTRGYEYRQMGQTLIQLTLAILAVAVGAAIVGRYLPSLPLFNRMVLKPEIPGAVETDPETGKPRLPDPDASLFFLIGETGRTTTALRPAGKARFGELLVDVIADGFYIDPDSLVEVIEVQGARVIVKQI